MNNGAFGENFPYTNFHNLNTDWIIKVVKEFEDHYSTINTAIEEGKEELATSAAEELSEMIETLNAWYTEHQNDISEELARAIQSINNRLAEVLSQIPSDYTALQNMIAQTYLQARVEYKNDIVIRNNNTYVYLEKVPSNSEWDGSKVLGMALGRLVTRGLNTAENMSLYNPHENLLNRAIRLDDTAIRADGVYTTREGMTSFERIPVIPNGRIIVSYILGSETYAIRFSRADGSALPTGISPAITYTNVEGGYYVPEGAYWMTFTCASNVADNAFVFCLSEAENKVSNYDIYPITTLGELVNGQPYNAFPSMTEFNNRKVMVWMSSSDHYNSENVGGTTIADIDAEGNLTYYPLITMNPIPWSGILRSGGLGTDRTGKMLLFAGFTNYKVNGNDTYDNVLLRLNENYEIIDFKVIQNVDNYCFSKMITTPSGKLIYSTYDSVGNIYMNISNQVYTGDNLQSLTWNKVTVIANQNTVAEADFTYTDNKLICVARMQTTSALYTETADLEGLSGWSSPIAIGEVIHAPRMIPYHDSQYIFIVGAKYIDSTHRLPIIAVYDSTNHNLIETSVLNPNTLRFSGYADIIRTGKYNFETIYYSDPSTGTNHCTQLFYQKVNIRSMCPSTKMFM